MCHLTKYIVEQHFPHKTLYRSTNSDTNSPIETTKQPTMPSQYYSSHPQISPLPHLSDIIKLKPEEEPHCVGFAATKGRRCHNPINARDRNMAVTLLHKGTRDLHQGYPIDDLLEDLAPLALCNRRHQNQAAGIVETWQRRVQRFERSYNMPAPVAPSRPPRATTSTSTSTSTPARTTGSSGQQELGVERDSSPSTERLQERVREMTLELERLRATVSATQSSVQNLDSGSNEQARAPSASVRPAGGVVDADTASSDGSAVSRGISSTRSSGTTVSSSPVTLSSVPISPASTILTSRLGGTPRHVRTTARITLPSSRAGDATRRPIEGECGICLNPLRRTRSRAASSFGDEEGDAANTADDTDSGYEEESEEEVGGVEGLTWCRAQCGVNYHAECIGQWLQESTHRNCPTCRSGWIE